MSFNHFLFSVQNVNFTLRSFRGSETKSATLTPRLILYPEVPFQKRPCDDSRSFFDFKPANIWNVLPLSMTPIASKLPSPPRRSPETQTCTSGEESVEPIGPPKRRRLSVAGDYKSTLKVPSICKQRPASTSSTWAPVFESDTLSPFISLEATNVFNDDMSDEEDDLEGVSDEQTLVRSLRKIAKNFPTDQW